MSQLVVMKSNRYGINLNCDPNCSFRDLLDAIIEKFKESEKFFKDAKMGISFEGRRLSAEEEYRIIDEIMQHSSVEIICILDHDPEHEEMTRRLMEQSLVRDQQIQQLQQQQAIQMQQMQEEMQMQAMQMQQDYAPVPAGDFYQGTLRSGQVIESEGSITIIGDVNPGAKIVSAGNIVILGALKGNVHAGCTGERDCFIFALDMDPIQIQIGDLIAKSPDKEPAKKRFRGKEKDSSIEPQIAVAKDGAIYIEPMNSKLMRDR